MRHSIQSHIRSNPSFLVLTVLLLSAVQLVAQDTPIATPGTQVATEKTPAAATNTDALRKATKNPVASLISVPVQNNDNFNIGPDNRTQNVLTKHPARHFAARERELESHNTHHYSDHLSAEFILGPARSNRFPISEDGKEKVRGEYT